MSFLTPRWQRSVEPAAAPVTAAAAAGRGPAEARPGRPRTRDRRRDQEDIGAVIAGRGSQAGPPVSAARPAATRPRAAGGVRLEWICRAGK